MLELQVTNPYYDQLVLTPSKGRSKNGPQTEDTWYDLNMNFVVERMKTVYGVPIEAWINPETGVKMCRKVGDTTEYARLPLMCIMYGAERTRIRTPHIVGECCIRYGS